MAGYLVLETAAFLDIAKKANTVAASRGEAYEKAAGVVLEYNGTVVCVRATNLDIFYTEWIEHLGVSTEQFSWRLSSRLLNAISNSLPTGTGSTVRLEVKPESEYRLTFTSGKNMRASMPLMLMNGFPDWGVFSPDTLIEVPGFTRAISMVDWASSEHETPAVLKGVHFDGERVYATNKLKACWARFVMNTTEPFTIPAAVVAQLVKTNGGGDAKLEYLGDKLHIMPNNHSQIQVIAFDEKYPNVQMLWNTVPPHWFPIRKTPALEVLNRAVPLGTTDRQPGMYVKLGKQELVAYAKTETDGATSGDTLELLGYLDHPRVEYFFVPSVLIAAVENAPEEDVTIQYDRDNPGRPWFISCGDEYSALISPRRQSSPATPAP